MKKVEERERDLFWLILTLFEKEKKREFPRETYWKAEERETTLLYTG